MNKAPLNSMGHVLILVIDVKHSPRSPKGPPYWISIFAVKFSAILTITITIFGVIVAIIRATIKPQPPSRGNGCHS